jgi:hypothetical protein
LGTVEDEDGFGGCFVCKEGLKNGRTGNTNQSIFDRDGVLIIVWLVAFRKIYWRPVKEKMGKMMAWGRKMQK